MPPKPIKDQIAQAITERPFGTSKYRNIVERSGSYFCIERAQFLPLDLFIAGFSEHHLNKGLTQNDWSKILGRARQTLEGKITCKTPYQLCLFPIVKPSYKPLTQKPKRQRKRSRESATKP